MDRVALCPFRRDASDADGRESAICGLLAAAFDSDDPKIVRVERAICATCCRIECPADARTNPVIASLIYGRALRQLEERPGGADADRLARLKADAQFRLPYSIGPLEHTPAALGILAAGERRLAVVLPPADRSLTWATAVLTAPRQHSTLAATLTSLHDGGFDDCHVFAEPYVNVPTGWAYLRLTRHAARLGQLRNFVFAANALLDEQPGADCYAIFEDDISAARGLRGWCDRQFWPGGHGIVSLYTSRVFADDRPGWQSLNLGRWRTYGSMAFVFQEQVLRALVSDEGVARHVERGWPSADAIVGEWALKCGTGIAYHTPSLIQHEGWTTAMAGHAMGRIGRATAVLAVEAIPDWRPPPPRPGKVGLLGWHTPSGLGYQNRDIAEHLRVNRWLAPRHPRIRRLGRPCIAGKYKAPWARAVSVRVRQRWLAGLDWLLFVEHPYLAGMGALAHNMGISVACVPNWEWLAPDLDWLPHVDLMICPTAFTDRMLRRWKRIMGFAWDVVHIPWPIDPRRFPFRRRERCRRFLFVNGTGGVTARRPDGSRTPYRRKGLGLVAETARLLPEVPFLVYSQVNDLPKLPANVEVRPPPARNSDLYRDGDVCVQPSHWEGLGLQLLECQAAGMPLVTTDAPPMNECRPYRVVSVAGTEPVFMAGDQPVDSQLVRPEDLAAVLGAIYDTDIRDASERAREYIETERSWDRLRDAIAALMPA